MSCIPPNLTLTVYQISLRMQNKIHYPGMKGLMMAEDKIEQTFEIQKDAIKMLDEAVEKHNLESRDKALRCLLDYCAEDGDWQDIFETVRCLRC